ncbi:bifunctional phosphopantothenoylcysteine decarboxylase/phosphopantothenate synthase [Erythrobacteraceae bacterium CFH 75059]|uniref:bifunctional phosphopantothenoylcysteine decarboxylase/phosphopantothenate synthase n=1 Tax=Qipengyuania thermophila TaxID=2509361 RepID=UPI001021A836|nr:bifunctional phosphopantothenoylcysteine decarboxylase/phosphopantothenate synthase [Qipengyuania thermophila]TCD01914.1 bifunctional phosphopantothenoylcysteine decarboxylase/phosphopantothenate synthase [Erythrobacteraceae bacterium CFH 75059]
MITDTGGTDEAGPLFEGAGGARRILLVVGGGIAAYKACELVRLIRRAGLDVTCVVTQGGQQFVTPMALAALSGSRVYTSLFDLKDEVEMGHIQLSREADLVVVCPATADLLAKMAAGIADDLATTLILATDKPVVAVPAMNVRMWQHEATRRNVDRLRDAGVTVLDPAEGSMACGETGPGRLPEPDEIWAALAAQLGLPQPLLPAGAALSGPQAPALTIDDLAAEALEPEEAEESEEGEEAEDGRPRGGLGSLLSAIIPRSARRAQPLGFDTPDGEGAGDPWSGADPQADPWPGADCVASPGAEDRLSHAGDTPLLARKGQAFAAPPTDRQALNHMVRTGSGAAAPEPLDESGAGAGGLSQPHETFIFDAEGGERPLEGRHVLVTAGPTWEAIDPVRFLANRSSGRQGFAIAGMAAAAGARVSLIAGPVALPTPPGVDRIDVESAEEMAAAVKQALPADIAFMVAAVADWRPAHVAPEKMKKRGSAPPALMLTENTDILASVAANRARPALLVGFAAETENVIPNAISKRKRKGADWIVANDVSTDVMGGTRNTISLITAEGTESFDEMSKLEVARVLVARAAAAVAPA